MEGDKARVVPDSTYMSFPSGALWKQLGRKHDLPWSLSLRVVVDGAPRAQLHAAVMRGDRNGGAHIHCGPAFRPLAGKQLVAWRFMRPDTLVCAVRTPGCSAAAAEGGEEAGCSMAAAEGGDEGAAPLVSSISRQPRRQVPATHTPSAPNRAASHTLPPTPAGLKEARGGQARKRQHLLVGGWLVGCLAG